MSIANLYEKKILNTQPEDLLSMINELEKTLPGIADNICKTYFNIIKQDFPEFLDADVCDIILTKHKEVLNSQNAVVMQNVITSTSNLIPEDTSNTGIMAIHGWIAMLMLQIPTSLFLLARTHIALLVNSENLEQYIEDIKEYQDTDMDEKLANASYKSMFTIKNITLEHYKKYQSKK